MEQCRDGAVSYTRGVNLECYKRSFNELRDVGTYHIYVRLYLISLMSRYHKKT
ncbi:hypothetical protein Hanom_Chr00s011813g01748131 [Helianthus anomalus]